jgi:heme-degrading monooxygenase HmoA
MNHTSYQIDIPQNTDVVVFCNGIKALNSKGFFWLWQQIFTAQLNNVKTAPGCVETKLAICSPTEVIMVSYWQNQQSLTEFFQSSRHRQMMKDTMKMIAVDSKAIALFNETYRPLKSGKYFNQPQGLAKIFPAIEPVKAVTT